MSCVYLCKCGCKVDKGGLRRQRKKFADGRTSRYVCKEHRREAIARIFKCQNKGCTNDILIEMPSTGKKTYCDVCRIIITAMQRKKYESKIAKLKAEKERKALQNKKPVQAFRGDYCRFSCKGKCNGCEDFLPIFRGVDPEKTFPIIWGLI